MYTLQTHGVLSWNVITLSCLFQTSAVILLTGACCLSRLSFPSPGHPSRTKAIPCLCVPGAHSAHAPQHQTPPLPPKFPLLPSGLKSFEDRDRSLYSQSLVTGRTVHPRLWNKSVNCPPSMISTIPYGLQRSTNEGTGHRLLQPSRGWPKVEEFSKKADLWQRSSRCGLRPASAPTGRELVRNVNSKSHPGLGNPGLWGRGWPSRFNQPSRWLRRPNEPQPLV